MAHLRSYGYHETSNNLIMMKHAKILLPKRVIKQTISELLRVWTIDIKAIISRTGFNLLIFCRFVTNLNCTFTATF